MRSVVRLYPGPPAFEISDLKFEISDVKSSGRVNFGAGWSSPVARWAHNPKVAGSNPAPATNLWNLEFGSLRFRLLIRGRSSVGRAPRLQRGGQGFESPRLHQHCDFEFA